MESPKVPSKPEERARVCKACGRRLLLEFFYRKRESFEWICIECKKAKRRERYKSCEEKTIPPSGSDVDATRVFESDAERRQGIELEKSSSNLRSPILEKDSLSQSRKDFFDKWEKRWNRKLTDSEKAEIETNLVGLIVALAEERFRQRGEYVDLSKVA